jgi:hypothetical protein
MQPSLSGNLVGSHSTTSTGVAPDQQLPLLLLLLLLLLLPFLPAVFSHG